MKKSYRLPCLMIGLLPLATLHAAQAEHVQAGHAWIRLLPAKLPAGGYLSLQNTGTADAMLVAAHSSAYGMIMLHQSTANRAGISDMAALGRLAIPAHGKVALAPGGYHLMLEKPAREFKPGDTVSITLDFADGSQLPVQFLVRPANAAEPE